MCHVTLKMKNDMKHLSVKLTISLTVVSSALSSNAATTTNAVLKIERLALFKNGLGYVTATATLPEHTRTVRLGQLPVPSYGTFWVGYPKELKVQSLTTAMETVNDLTPVSAVEQMLRLNPGRRVMLHTAGGTGNGAVVIEGVVEPLPVTPPPAEPPSPYFMDVRRMPDRSYYGGYPPAPQTGLVLVKTDRGMVALAPGSVQRVDFVDGQPLCVITNKQKRPAIRMELEQAANGEKIAVSYLARGITWVPSYRLDLSDDKTAVFLAQAQIINELTDFQDAHVDLVTGFPNIQFADLPNPAAMTHSLAEFLKSLSSGRAGEGGRSYVMQQQALMANAPVFDDSPSLPTYSTAAQGQTAEDLFLYPLPRLSLKRGETATLPLFTAQMPYRHLYTWKIGDLLDGDVSRPRGDGSRQRDDGRNSEEVWHVCRLVNAAKMPLTTAAAEFVKDGQFVGQDTCFYTSPGAEASIRINRAMNVQAEQAEIEVERKRNAANFYGWGYDLVKVTGELKVRNRLDKAIDLEITKELSGEVLEKPEGTKDLETAKGLKQVNPKHVLTWTRPLEPDKELKIVYLYQLYVRP